MNVRQNVSYSCACTHDMYNHMTWHVYVLVHVPICSRILLQILINTPFLLILSKWYLFNVNVNNIIPQWVFNTLRLNVGYIWINFKFVIFQIKLVLLATLDYSNVLYTYGYFITINIFFLQITPIFIIHTVIGLILY